jgi:hypothetical protein
MLPLGIGEHQLDARRHDAQRVVHLVRDAREDA